MSKYLICFIILVASCSRSLDVGETSWINTEEYSISCNGIHMEMSFKEFIELSNERECNFSVAKETGFDNSNELRTDRYYSNSIADNMKKQSVIDSLESVFRSFKGRNSNIVNPILEQCLSRNVLDSLNLYPEPYTFRIQTSSEKFGSSSSKRYTHFVVHNDVIIEVLSALRGSQ